MSHGGKRPNSGPKKHMSPYGEETTVMRLPTSAKPAVLVFLEEYKQSKATSSLPPLDAFQAAPNLSKLARAIYSGTVQAGQSRFPSPAQDYEQKFLDLNEFCIKHPAATFFFTAKGNSMEGARIFDGDILLVDRTLPHKHNAVVVAAVDGEWVVKRLYKKGGVIKLLSAHPDYQPIKFSEGQELIIFGVVDRVIGKPF